MSVSTTAARFVSLHGSTMTLARTGEGTTISLKGKRIPGTMEAVGAGTAIQQVFRVKIATTELLASAWATKTPKRGDALTVDGRVRTVLDARPLADRGTTVLWELEVSG